MNASGKLLTLLAFVLALMPQALLAYQERCGTAELLQNFKNRTSNVARTAPSGCTVEDFYDSVYSRKTRHFEIFYTKTGPHATTDVFVDSVEAAMEAAYTLFSEKQKPLLPKGDSISYHYQKKVSDGYYPIEVVEITLTRDLKRILKSRCNACFALTVPTPQETWGNSAILVDNDLRHPPEIPVKFETFKKGSKECSYAKSTNELQNIYYGYSYAKKIGPGLRITAFHEFFHAIQFRYQNSWEFPYWLESQASAMEEIGAPDVDDYLQTLDTLFTMNWENFRQATNTQKYSLSAFFIAMHNLLGPSFNTRFLEASSKIDQDSLSQIFAMAASSLGKNPNAVFHEFAKRAFFSGSRFQEKQKLSDDQDKWPKMQVHDSEIEIKSNSSPYFTYRYTKDFPGNLQGKITYLVKSAHDSLYRAIDVNSSSDYQKKYHKIFNADTSVLVYSYLLENEMPQDSDQVDQKFMAYPNPWKGANPLCFTGLPSNQGVLEIRTRTGSLASSWNYSFTEFCIDQEEIHSQFAPGLYYYRAGRSGKMQKLLILK